MTDKPSANFRKLLKSINNEEKVVPLLRTALTDPDFPSFNVQVDGWSERQPDGWFHPSTHPVWDERLLYQYLTEPDLLVSEPFDPTGTLAVTAGSFFHSFIQTVGVAKGVLVKQPEVCGCGMKHPERAEIQLVDAEAGTRGHTDGEVFDGDLWEFKTMAPAKMYGIPQGSPTDPEVLGWFIEKCFGYYLQAQEYLRMGQRRNMVVVIMEMTYPFTMREIHVPYDHAVAEETRQKYLRVRQAVADGRPPTCFCGPFSNDCPSRLACWA